MRRVPWAACRGPATGRGVPATGGGGEGRATSSEAVALHLEECSRRRVILTSTSRLHHGPFADCKMEKGVKLLSHVRLFATSWTVQAPPSMEFSRKGYWSGWPFPSPGELLDPGIEPGSPALQAGSLPSTFWLIAICPGSARWIALVINTDTLHPVLELGGPGWSLKAETQRGTAHAQGHIGGLHWKNNCSSGRHELVILFQLSFTLLSLC